MPPHHLAARPNGLLSAALAAASVASALVLIEPRAATGQAGPSVSGVWLDNEGKAAVEVKPCGGEMCGAIVWLKDPLDPRGKPWTDMLNPDAAKRGRKVCGLQIMGGLKPAPGAKWADGWVYDPEEGKTFNLELSLKDTETLTVFGYAGVRMLSETFHWKRLAVEQPRCKA